MRSSIKSFITMAIAAVFTLVTFASAAIAASNYTDYSIYRFYHNNQSTEKAIVNALMSLGYATKAESSASKVLGGSGVNWSVFAGSGNKIPVYFSQQAGGFSTHWSASYYAEDSKKLTGQTLWIAYDPVTNKVGPGGKFVTNLDQVSKSCGSRLAFATSQFYFANRTKLYENPLGRNWSSKPQNSFNSSYDFFSNALAYYTAAVEYDGSMTYTKIRSMLVKSFGTNGGLTAWQSAHNMTDTDSYRAASLAAGYWMVKKLGNVPSFLNALSSNRMNKYKTVEQNLDAATRAHFDGLAPFADAFWQIYKLRYMGKDADFASSAYRQYWGF